MICRYVLLQDLELADHGKLFCTSLGGIDDAEDEHHKEHKIHETEKGSHDGAESPADPWLNVLFVKRVLILVTT